MGREGPDDGLLDSVSQQEGGILPYPDPFHENYNDDPGEEPLDRPRALHELKMCELSATLREKPQWHEKILDANIVAKWRKEAEEQSRRMPESERLSSEMIDYVLSELTGYATLRDAETGIEMACYERVWKSDTLVKPEVREALVAAAALLESEEKDWHPGSDGKVLDLVHPSLYPLVYGRTAQRDAQHKLLAPIPSPEVDLSSAVSEQYAWLPADFAVAADRTVRLVSPYINNLDATAHSSVYPVITSLVEASVPMYERVLSDLRRPLTVSRLDPIECIWEHGMPWPSDEEFDNFPDREAESRFFDSQPKRLPKALAGGYTDALSLVEKTVDLTGQTLQIIVKLANIVLTPEKPDYPGGSWHVEGMENEHIVASFIYYYDEDNLETSRLSFRTAVAQPEYHEQDDTLCMKMLYGLKRDDACVQERGGNTTSQDRCIAFPNIYQHCVSPFSLADKTKSGHRKIVALFLVDPAWKIPSTTDVPPQQAHLYEDAVLACPALSRLPPELRVMIAAHVVGTKMTRIEAEVIREEVIRERSKDSRSGQRNSFFTMTFNMCEH